MTATSAVGAMLGLAFGFGLVLVVSRLPVMRRPSLDQRLAPYLVDRRDAVRRIVPDNPRAWLITGASRRMADRSSVE